MTAALIRSELWPAHVVALGSDQLRILEAYRELRGSGQSIRTTLRAIGALARVDAGTARRGLTRLQALGLVLRISTRGRTGSSVLYRPSPAGAPPALRNHRRTLARMIGRPAPDRITAPASTARPAPPISEVDPMAPRLTFAQRMAQAGLDFAAIGVDVPEGVTLPLVPELGPSAGPALGGGSAPAQTVTCSAYSEHQLAHRRGPDGWTCTVCEDEATPGPKL